MISVSFLSCCCFCLSFWVYLILAFCYCISFALHKFLIFFININKIEEHMASDDETTAKQLGELLAIEGHTLSKSTILRTRRSLGWTYRGSS